MWGKVLGALIGGGLGLVVAWSPGLAIALGLLGGLVGHFMVDRDPPMPDALSPSSAAELLGAPSGSPPPTRLPSAAPSPPRHSSPRPTPPSPTPSLTQTLIEQLCPIFIEVARCDGPVVQSEVRVIREFFTEVLHFDGPAADAVRLALKAALASPPQDLEALARRARAALKPSLRLDVVSALYDLGLADAELTRREADVLKCVVGQFNLSEEQLQEITRRYLGTGESHYRTLCLEPTATDEEIRAAFRRLASENHPDRVASRTSAEVEAAARRFREVKEAYEELKKLRGL